MATRRRTSVGAATLGFVAAVATATGAQSPILTFDGAATPQFVCGVGQSFAAGLTGPPGAPFALLASPGALEAATPFGVLRADPFAPGAALVYDGYDVSHPLAALAHFDAGGSFVATTTPFLYGAAYYAAYRVQALAPDPTSPFGHALTNTIELQYAPLAPEVYGAAPNLAVPGDVVQIYGAHFLADPAAHTVTLDGRPCTPLAASAGMLTVLLPPDAASGPLVVAHAGGSSAYLDALAAWLAVSPPAPLLPAAATPGAPAALGAGQTHFGYLAPGQTHDYVVHLEPGQSLRAELYPFDATLPGISFPAPPPGLPFADPTLTLLKNAASPWTLFVDQDGGPAVCAAIGVGPDAPRYVADAAEDVVVRAAFRHQLAAGPYALILAVDPPAVEAFALTAVVPEIVSPGDVAVAYGTGFQPGVEGHAILLGPLVVEPLAITATTMTFVVPPDARSGALGLLGPGFAVAPDPESVETWLVVAPPGATSEIEGVTPLLTLPAAYGGVVGTGSDQDDVFVTLEAGQRLSVECYGGDVWSGDIENSWTYASPILDPEIRILHPTLAWPLYIWEWNAGPGVNAMVGNGGTTPVFTAPATGVYRVKISSSYWGSWGPYLAIFALQP